MANILLIEDDEELACALSASLSWAGHQLTTALDGFAALKALDTDARIDLLVTDIVMPPGQPHGLALARLARQKRPDLAVILMTGYPDVRQYVDGYKLLLKPVEGDQLLSEITASLARARARQQAL
jgi:DNA-binding NtrC family response regulator